MKLARSGDIKAKRLLRVYAQYEYEEENERNRAYNLFTPQDYQIPFFKSTKSRILVHSANGTGKSRCAYHKAAGLSLGYDTHGGCIPKNNKGVIVCPTWGQIAELAYAQLFEKGSFDVCGECGKSRQVCEEGGKCGPATFEGWTSRAIPADPFIPPELVVEARWLHQKNKWPISIDVKNIHGGISTIFFRPGDGLANKSEGFEWHWALVDEVIEEPVKEAIIRGLRKNNGPYIHVGTPLESGLCMIDMYEAWQKGSPDHDCFKWTMEQNKFVSPKFIAERKRTLSPEMWRVRGEGEFLMLQGLVYPEFNVGIHCCEKFNDWTSWTRYLTIDPGWNHDCGILEVAVPPTGTAVPGRDGKLRKTKEGDFFVTWAFKSAQLPLSGLAAMVEKRNVAGEYPIYRIYIDRASEQTDQGKPVSTRKQLKRDHGIKTFLPPGGREEKQHMHMIHSHVKPGLRLRRDGYSRITFFPHLDPLFGEFKRYIWEPDTKSRYRFTPRKKNDELMDCLQYITTVGPKFVDPALYHKPSEHAGKAGSSDLRDKQKALLERFKKERREREERMCRTCQA